MHCLIVPGPALCHRVTRAVYCPDLALDHSWVKVVQAHPTAPVKDCTKQPWPGHWLPHVDPTKLLVPDGLLSLSGLPLFLQHFNILRSSPSWHYHLTPLALAFELLSFFSPHVLYSLIRPPQCFHHLHSHHLPWNTWPPKSQVSWACARSSLPRALCGVHTLPVSLATLSGLQLLSPIRQLTLECWCVH